MDNLTRKWVHSYEEETLASTENIFRPDDFKKFPGSRFRMIYNFRTDGSCEWHYLAPNDGHEMKIGSWHLYSDILTINQNEEMVKYRVNEVTKDVLLITRLSNN